MDVGWITVIILFSAGFGFYIRCEIEHAKRCARLRESGDEKSKLNVTQSKKPKTEQKEQ